MLHRCLLVLTALVLSACSSFGLELPSTIDGPVGSIYNWTFEKSDGSLTISFWLDDPFASKISNYTLAVSITEQSADVIHVRCTGTLTPSGFIAPENPYSVRTTAAGNTRYSIFDDDGGKLLGVIDTHKSSSSSK